MSSREPSKDGSALNPKCPWLHGAVQLNRSAIPTEGGIAALEGRLVCAVVYDSDLSVDGDQDFASLKGAILGLTAFQVTSVGPDPAGPELPSITVDLLPSSDVQAACATIAQ